VSFIPALGFTIGVIALFFYPITKATAKQMQLELDMRRK